VLALPVVDRLQPGMLVLADRGLAGFSMWQRAAATGADLLSLSSLLCKAGGFGHRWGLIRSG